MKKAGKKNKGKTIKMSLKEFAEFSGIDPKTLKVLYKIFKKEGLQ